MDDAVIDATVLAYANGPIGHQISGALARCLPIITKVVDEQWRCRYNIKLLNEYCEHVKVRRNDMIVVFFTILDSPRAFVARNNLRHHEYAKAIEIRWPPHDHHLLAAAIDGINPSIVVTEDKLARLSQRAKREFGVRVLQV
jgi:hypothetical protein